MRATWIDVNTNVTRNTLPDRVPDAIAIMDCSLYNLLNCHVGGRARTFEPLYGSYLYHFLQEVLSETTALSIRMSLLASIARWEPRIELDHSNTWVRPNYDLPGYVLRITGRLVSGEDTNWYTKEHNLPYRGSNG